MVLYMAKFNAAFIDWFGDSKVVDGRGRPRLVYHGTDKRFKTFKVGRSGSFGSGIYFTSNKQSAEIFARTDVPMIIEAHLTIERPYYFDIKESMNLDFLGEEIVRDIYPKKEADKIVDKYIKLDTSDFGSEIQEELSYNHDGIIAIWPDRTTDYVVFAPDQVEVVRARKV